VLHRVENASVTFRYGTFSMRKGYVRLPVGRETVDFGSVIPKEFRELQVAQQEYPLRLPKIGERRYWQFQDRVYWESEDLDADEVYALLVSQQQREQGRKRGRIERAKAMVAMGMQPQDQPQRRDVIPDDVKQLVWLRDGGQPALRRSGGAAVRPHHPVLDGRQQQP